MGLFNSGGTRNTTLDNNLNGGDALNDNDLGYSVRVNPSTRAASIFERTGGTGGAALFGGGGTAILASTAATGGSNLQLDPLFTAPDTRGIAFPISFTLTRTASGIQIDSSFNGGTHTITDTTPTTFDYDTVGFFGASALVSSTFTNASRGITYDDVVVNYVAIPEASSFLAVGVVTFGGLCLGQLRRRVCGKS